MVDVIETDSSGSSDTGTDNFAAPSQGLSLACLGDVAVSRGLAPAVDFRRSAAMQPSVSGLVPARTSRQQVQTSKRTVGERERASIARDCAVTYTCGSSVPIFSPISHVPTFTNTIAGGMSAPAASGFTNSAACDSEAVVSSRAAELYFGSTKVNAEGLADDQDLIAIRETCNYMTNVLANFNARFDSVHPEAQHCIEQLNAALGNLIMKKDPVLKPHLPRSARPHLHRVQRKSNPRYDLQPDCGISTDTETDKKPILKNKVSFKRQRNPVSSSHAPEYRCYQLSDSSVTDASSDQESLIRPRRAERVFSRESSGAMSAESVIRALARLDNRSVPKPEIFDSESGQSFVQFLQMFEEYCRHTFRGSSSLWIGELGRLLRGDMKSAFDALKVPGDGYRSLKEKLLKWKKDTHELYENTTKSRFTKAIMRSDESLRLYAARLEKAFRLAHCSRDVETSKALRRKYFDSVPDSFRKQLQTARSINLTMNHCEIKWSTILALASQQDAGNAPRDREELPVVEDQVWLSFPRYRDSSKDHSGTGPVTSYESGQQRYKFPQRETRSRYSVWQTNAECAADSRKSRQTRSVSRPFDRTGGEPRRRPSSDPRDAHMTREDMEYSRSKTCFHCNRIGHIKNQCRRFLNQCLACGSGDHRIATCPNRRSNCSGPVSNAQSRFDLGSSSNDARGASGFSSSRTYALDNGGTQSTSMGNRRSTPEASLPLGTFCNPSGGAIPKRRSNC